MAARDGARRQQSTSAVASHTTIWRKQTINSAKLGRVLRAENQTRPRHTHTNARASTFPWEAVGGLYAAAAADSSEPTPWKNTA